MTPSPPPHDATGGPPPSGFRVWRPGLINYRDAQTRQEALVAERPSWSHDLLILLEHPPVITLGRNSSRQHLLWTDAALEKAGIDCVTTRRGGDITLHNPGQLVGYPIVDLNHFNRDLHLFLRRLEEILVCTLADFGLAARTVTGRTGVWVDDRKIASIGVAVRRWISYHGFAVNIDNDLTVFRSIVPCGLENVSMTSLAQELGGPVDKRLFNDNLVRHFGRILRRPYLGRYEKPTTPQT